MNKIYQKIIVLIIILSLSLAYSTILFAGDETVEPKTTRAVQCTCNPIGIHEKVDCMIHRNLK